MMHNIPYLEKNSPQGRPPLLWHLRQAPEEACERIIQTTGCLPATAAVMAARGLTRMTALRKFLHPSVKNLPHPDSISDLSRASERIVQAVFNREPIMIFGDYDADGVTSTALVYGFLLRVTPEVRFHLPHREKEGYGLKSSHIPDFARSGIRLIITVDCGISSHDAVLEAGKNGMDVIITDHHRPGDHLPDASAIVNPQRPDCRSGLRELAGVGVAFYLVMAIRKKLREAGFWQEGFPEPPLLQETDLVAIGTVADLVPLTGINRILVHAGINAIRKNPRPGIQALCRVAGISCEDLDSEAIAFRLAPRINAAGRMAHPEIATRLLCASSVEEAMPMAMELDRLNGSRQDEENRILLPIENCLKENPALSRQPALILHSEDWSPGVIGIVASRLVRRHHRPAILIATRGENGQASGRSIPGIDLYKSLSHCRSLLEQFGGHTMAAGFRIQPKNILSFQKEFCSLMTSHKDIIGQPPAFIADALITLDDLCPELLDEIQALGPFGMENPAPLFVARHLEVMGNTAMGSDGKHRRLLLRQAACIRVRRVTAVVFGAGKNAFFPHHLDTILFRIRKGWGKDEAVQIQIEAWC
ncbi:single-stranded-DNA-specific exonuclease [Desulfobotulus alkaliphilus]|uniref:Single-stranded-DNA-specific exonuclease RecJ n=1 Tax=Desulfobotulus alkaliphilus TaxID=622671 RepID=A0A562RQI7_9BACT|nr:single-stranded-DNA-specific exonuclease [Desulfobotulus alkaliphilus]